MRALFAALLSGACWAIPTLAVPILTLAPGIGARAALAQDQGQFGRVIRIDRNAFSARAGLITFDEIGLGVRNPVYPPRQYGADSDGVTVTFGGFFQGQKLASHDQCPPGASRTGCVEGTPSAPLKIAASAPATKTQKDGSNPRSPSLSGSPTFNGPISMVFDRDVAGVGLFGGFFDRKRTTAIQVFSRDGRLIGGVRNIRTGMEYLALVTEDGSDTIAGLQFSLVGPEPRGFGIDDLSFAIASQLDATQIPELTDLLGGTPASPTPDGGNAGSGSISELLGGGAAAGGTPETPSVGDGGGADGESDGGSDGGSISDLFK